MSNNNCNADDGGDGSISNNDKKNNHNNKYGYSNSSIIGLSIVQVHQCSEVQIVQQPLVKECVPYA